MNYVSVCSGIEAATVAWHPLGWKPQAFAEVAPFPSKVLAHHYPQVPNVGDFSIYQPTANADLLVGGTPCQSFSVAGLRGGLGDDRGNLALEFCRLADRLRARWIVWENVPGVLSSNGGRDFGSIIGALAELGYGFAWRTLDAQNFGVAQRRRRVFLVGYLGDWRRAAAVLFERDSLRGNLATGRAKGKGVARDVAPGARAGEVIPFDATQITSAVNRSNPQPGDPSPTLLRGASAPTIAFMHRAASPSAGPLCPTLTVGHEAAGVLVSPPLLAHHGRANAGDTAFVPVGNRARRLTPRECERLQGFPDDYTSIPGSSDAARYKALGNLMAVPVMRWIGERIAVVEEIP